MAGPLRNTRHEKLAMLIAEGKDGTEAYRTVYKCKNRATARANVARLLANATGVSLLAERIMELQSKTEDEWSMTQKERRKFMARTVRANLARLDLDKDGDLLAEYITEDLKEGGQRIKVKLSDKRACVMDDAKLAGDLVDNVDLTSGGEPMAMQIIFAEPPVSKRRAGSV